MRNLTLKIGDQNELEQERLREWRDMTPQQRLDAFTSLLEEWWASGEQGLKRIYSILSVP